MLELNSQFFGIAATILSILGTLPYIRSILKGETKPSGASWWTWTLLAIITVISSWAAGAPLEVLFLPIWLVVLQLTIALLSIKYGDNNWDKLNKFCVLLACVGMALWWFTGEPLLALAFSIVADVFASIPNIRHVWTNPEQENRIAWTIGWSASVAELFAVTQWSLAESSWAIYFFANMTITILLIWRRVFRTKKSF